MISKHISRSFAQLCGQPWSIASHRRVHYLTTSGKLSDPLRILFCGSDNVSVEALQAVHTESLHNPELVERVEVGVLPPKASGRGLKTKVELPCEKAAASLGLQCHQIPTFTGWQMPDDINLIIAVSFGLFVPPRLLRQAKYGGLNVHPSFLPDLRGPAPIHHAVLQGDTHTGVSLQTLHEKTFDHGTVLAQTPAPGIAILAHPTLSLTTRKLGIECAEMLVQGLRDGLHVPPYENAGWRNADGLRHAPKLYPGDLKIQWNTWSTEDWQRRLVMKRAIWTNAMTNKGKRKRVIFHDARPVSAADVQGTRGMVSTVVDGEGDPVRREVIVNQGDGSVYFLTGRGEWVRVRRGRLEAEVEKDAAMVVRSLLVRDA